jgi:arylformamidase
MMADPIDVSVRIHPDMSIWPGSIGVRVTRTRSFEQGDGVVETRLDMDVHCGTHVEGPMHLVEGGAPVQDVSLDTFVGPVWVADVRGSDRLTREVLAGADVPADARRVLLKTDNSVLWTDPTRAFTPEFAALTVDGAQWAVDRGLKLIGIDYLSIQRFEDRAETHRRLMLGGVAILEGLDLRRANGGWYRLTCLPLLLDGTEAAPARAILEPLP